MNTNENPKRVPVNFPMDLCEHRKIAKVLNSPEVGKVLIIDVIVFDNTDEKRIIYLGKGDIGGHLNRVKFGVNSVTLAPTDMEFPSFSTRLATIFIYLYSSWNSCPTLCFTRSCSFSGNWSDSSDFSRS